MRFKGNSLFWIFALHYQALYVQFVSSHFKMQRNLENVLIEADDIRELKAWNEIDCARDCMSEIYCAGFALHDELKRCRLFGDLKLKGKYALGWMFYQKEGPHCSKADGYTLYSSLSLCLKFYGNKTDYLSSVEQCRSDGAALIRIDNHQTQNIAYTYLQSEMQYQGFVLIQGQRDPGNLNDWLLDDGSLLGYLPWNSGQPETTSQEVLVINTRAGGLWHDADLTQVFAFLCEIQLDI